MRNLGQDIPYAGFHGAHLQSEAKAQPTPDSQPSSRLIDRRGLLRPSDHRVGTDDILPTGHGGIGSRVQQNPLVALIPVPETTLVSDMALNMVFHIHEGSPIQGCATSSSMGASVFA